MHRILILNICFVSNLVFGAQVELGVKLSPAGSFKAVTNSVIGKAKLVGNKIIAENIEIKMDTFKTGISLRDKHFAEKIEAKKYPIGLCLKAQGQDGKGTGTIKIRGKEKTVSGTYEIKNNILIASFPLTISDFGITGIKYMGVGVKDEVNVRVEIPVEESAKSQ